MIKYSTFPVLVSPVPSSEAQARIGQRNILPQNIKTRFIEDLAVTTAKIGSLAVTNAKVSGDLDAGKVITGILTSSDGKTYFNLDDDILIVNDGTNDRVLLGLDTGGF